MKRVWVECKPVLQCNLILNISVDLFTCSINIFEHIWGAKCKVHADEAHRAPKGTYGPGVCNCYFLWEPGRQHK